MDIKSVSPNLINNRANESAKSQEKTAAPSTSGQASAPTDKVTLTDTSSRISQLEMKAASSNIDNQARIEALRESINNGSYQVDSQKIAAKLIQTESLMNG